jgi:hypothetical protein
MNQDKRTEKCQCETCGNIFQGEVIVSQLGGRTREIKPWECPTRKEKRESEAEKERQAYMVVARREQKEERRQQSGIPEGLITVRSITSTPAGRIKH